jgi:4-diphosphocytidyl-2-C-methyl-D-erythritol kinase
MSQPRRASLRALAKINLDLRVVGKRPDGYHEIRTIFQTISLGDDIEVAFTPSRRTRIEVTETDIPDNLMARAAQLCLDAMRVTGTIEFRLRKRIPMGGGLGGGSSDAAAVLLALPVLAGKRLEMPALIALAAQLGSDVAFFLLGGAAVGLGRGEELYPLPDFKPLAGLLVAPGLHSSTREAYAAMDPRLTTELKQNNIVSFESGAWMSCGGLARDRFPASGINDFEPWVFKQYPVVGRLKRKLQRLGAAPAMMSGSGSSVFGLFRTRQEASRAVSLIGDPVLRSSTFPIALVSRSQYRGMWWRRLQAHMTHDRVWPPLSRYAR